MIKNYYQIKEVETLSGSDVTKVIKIKPINRHYTFVTLRVNILSKSKRIKNLGNFIFLNIITLKK